MDGDNCRACKRQVHDITDWSDARRVAFLSACTTEVCVSYRLPVTAAALVAVAAAAAPLPAAAECPPMVEEMIIVGGLIDLDNVEYVAEAAAADPAIAELPVVYEGDDSGRPAPAGGQT